MKFVITLIVTHLASFICADSLLWIAPYDESKVDLLCQRVNDPEVSYANKLEIINAHSSLPIYTEYYDKLSTLYNRLLDESYKQADSEGVFLCICSLANLYFGLLDRINTEKYINKAEEMADLVKNVSSLAYYYNIKAQYIQHYIPDRMPEAVNNYQISLSNYEKAGIKGKETEIAIMLRNLSTDAFLRNDSVYINKNVKRLSSFQNSRKSPVIEFLYLDVAAMLHTVHYHYFSDERFLDSTAYYLQQCLDIHKQRLLPKSFDYICIDIVTIYAETVSMKKEPNISVIDSFLTVAINNNVDSMGMARIYQTKARSFFNSNMLDSAETMALKSQSYLVHGYRNNDYSLEKRNIDFLCVIYEMKGDYLKAIEYNNQWTKKADEIRANEVIELELQYEADMKDSELKQLYAEELLHKNRYRLIFATCALLCLIIFFMVFILWYKRRNLNIQIALIAAEKEEMKLKVKLKEEQTVKTLLERYMALSDFRLKELEIIGKTKDLEQLYKNKEELDQQVDLFRQKVEALEASIKKDNLESNDLQHIIIEDLRRLFAKQTTGDKFIEQIKSLNLAYVDTIIAMSNETLSVSYLKYCVCFAIGMGNSELADYFNIEQNSVHMIRYRLKKKFRLSNDDDLSIFLQELNGVS